MLGGKGKGGRVGQRESPSGTEVSPCLRVANLQKIFFSLLSLFHCIPLAPSIHTPHYHPYCTESGELRKARNALVSPPCS
jgi:hypothetical protein